MGAMIQQSKALLPAAPAQATLQVFWSVAGKIKVFLGASFSYALQPASMGIPPISMLIICRLTILELTISTLTISTRTACRLIMCMLTIARARARGMPHRGRGARLPSSRGVVPYAPRF